MPDPDRMTDEEVLDEVQRRTLTFFWEFAHPTSLLARDRSNPVDDPENDRCAVGGTGMGIMALIVGVERGWLRRAEVVDRLRHMLKFLLSARSYHGVLPHFVHGRTGETVPLSRKDDGGDLVETAFLVQGLLCARTYFASSDPDEVALRGLIGQLVHEVEWGWHTRDGRNVLTWHWSVFHGWSMDFEVRGWNECLITYVLAAGAERHGIDPEVYHRGWAGGPPFRNERRFYDIELPLGPDFGGPAFFTHYSFLCVDPHGLRDRYADYAAQNRAHIAINYEHCRRNPNGHPGYSESCWGLTASDSDGANGYQAHAPDNDVGVISPTAALASMPYAPEAAMRAARYFMTAHNGRLWTELGPMDAFNTGTGWFSETCLAIDQAPIIVMIENHRTGLLWKLGMRAPEIRRGLTRLGFTSPHLAATA